MVATTLDRAALQAVLRGPVIVPGDGAYDEARKVYNAMHDRRPAVVVRCVDAGDVMAAVNFARGHGGDLSVRGGSHSAPGFGTNDGGVVIDLSLMKGIRVDPRARTVRAEGGCTWGDLNHAVHAFGLATTGGIISTTGIAGLTLGGGIGYLARGCGLSLDNLLSADVVTADGQFLVASERENEDLFWALRGGGGNFGVVTSFEYRLHLIGHIVTGIFVFPLDRARDLFKFYREYIETAPEQVGGYPAYLVAPPLPFLPEEAHGKTFCAMVACWTGPPEEAEAVFAPIRNVGPRIGEMVAPMPYPMINTLFDELMPPGLQQYWKGSFASELTDGAIDAHVEHGPKIPNLNSAMHIYPINGACHRVSPDATAFAYRDAKFATVIAGVWPDPADNEKNVKWVKDYYKALEPHSAAGGYINFMDGDDQGRIKDNYKGNYDRLAKIKAKYDPTNLFRMNQNIKPRA
ncbi:MAG: FAD-binding oxidoreductase [Chloroflexi bacterium]|nr:FAD-binding oxidoreductase [Chloroflexota bacterium]